jgi:hypothetical protein
MKWMPTYQNTEFGRGRSAFGMKTNATTTRRILFDHKLLMHSTNSIARIRYEVRTGKGTISLQRISTVPVEKVRSDKNALGKTPDPVRDRQNNANRRSPEICLCESPG